MSANGSLGICMVAAKFYARSDMGGGLERSARRLFQHLLSLGQRVTVLTRNYDRLPSRETIEGVQVVRFPVWGRSRVGASLSFLLQAMWWLIVHRREYQLVHCHQSYSPAVIGSLAKVLLSKPVLVKISTADVFSERRQLEQLPLFRCRRWLLRGIDRFVAVNTLAIEEFTDLGIDRRRIIHIPNGVPPVASAAFDREAKQAARARLGIREERLVVFVGRLSAEKNLAILVAAWPGVLRHHADAHLTLVGDGGTFRSVEADLQQRVAALGLQTQIHFTGRVHNVQDYLLAADLFVLPSSTEGMSNALLEAMAVGLPVVATRVPGNMQVIRDGENGLLVEPGNAEALTAAVTRLLSAPQEAERLARAARHTVEERFTIHRVGEAYLRLYRELATSSG